MFTMNRSLCSVFVICKVLPFIFTDSANACFGDDIPELGGMTQDYDLMEGSDLMLNCYLTTKYLPFSNKRINSSDLVIEKRNEDLSHFSRVIDEFTLQLKIPKASVNDSGVYICRLRVSKDLKVVVCAATVEVGYPPLPIKEFSCVNENFEVLNCKWSTDENNIRTRYTIVTYLLNDPYLVLPCPTSTVLPNSCEWSRTTEPKFLPFTRNFTLTITGSNSLGITVNNFTVDLCSTVIPSIPENLEVTNISEESATINWKSPIKMFRSCSLIYQLKISIKDSSNFSVYDVEDRTSFHLKNLAPDTTYNVFLRCRSIDSELNQWSNSTSLTFKTLFDGNLPNSSFVISKSLALRAKKLLNPQHYLQENKMS